MKDGAVIADLKSALKREHHPAPHIIVQDFDGNDLHVSREVDKETLKWKEPSGRASVDPFEQPKLKQVRVVTDTKRNPSSVASVGREL